MSKKTYLLLFLTIVLGVLSCLGATVWTVGTTGDYTTIQAAISAATTVDGDIIQIDAGTYTEALSLGKSLTLIGSGPASNPTTIITSSASPIVQLTVTGKSFTFQNLIIEGVSTNLGIRAGSSISIQDLNLLDVIARNCKVAVYLSENNATTHVNHLLFDNLTLTNNTHIGAYIGRSVVNGIVTNSTFSNNGYSDLDATAWQKCGIQFIDFYGAIMPRVQVTNSTFINNGVGASSIERTGLVLYTAANTLSANELMTVSGCTFTDHPLYAVRIRNGYNVGNQATVNGTFTNNYLDIWFSNIDGYTSSTTSVRRSFTGTRTVGAGPTFDFNSIQAAVSSANAGETISVAAGTYIEPIQIDVNKNLTILGASAATTIIKPGFNTTAGGNVKAESFIYIDPMATVVIKNFTIDCLDQNVNHAIQSRGALNIEDCVITNVRWGTYNGRGIVYYGGITGNLAKNITMSNIERIGIHVRGNVMSPNPVVTIQNMQYTGKGTGNWIDYAVEFGAGGSGLVDNLTATNCLGVASSDGSTSAAILATDYYGGGTVVNVINSNLYNNSTGIYVGYNSTDATQLTASNNSFSNNGIGIRQLGTQPVNATYNYWGDNDPSDNLYGNVTYDPWWQDVAMTILGSNAPIENINRNTFFNDLQAAIDDPATINGDVINIYSGTISLTSTVVVNKSITIAGPLPVRDGPAILEGTNSSVPTVLEIAASNVTIQNLVITHSNMPLFGTFTWNELYAALVRIPAEIEPDLTGIVFQNNTIYIPAQTGAMNTWTGVAFTIGSRSVSGIIITGNTVYNTRNGIVAGYNNTVNISNNVIYNTKGGIMNYTGSQADADNRILLNNTWNVVHNEWDIVWNSGGAVYAPDYQSSVLDVSNANNGAYVLSLLPTSSPTPLTGNRSHIFINGSAGTTTQHNANGNKNVPYATFALGVNAVVPGGTVYVADGIYVEQVHINKEGLKIYGQSRDGVVIKSPATLPLSYTTSAVNKPVLFIDGVANVTIMDLTVDGDNQGNANNRFQGIGFWNSGGMLEDVAVVNVRDNPFSGVQHGVGIFAYNNTPAVNYSIALNRVDVYGFQKNALALNGNAASQNLAVNLDYVNVTGAGPTDVTAQNGIQISDATGTVDNCSVSDIFWTGGTWTASGYLVQYTDGLVLTNNTSTNCQTGVYAYANTGLELQGNVISGETKYGILDYYGVDTIINGNSISDALYGLYSYLTDGSEITGNTFDENAYALILNGTDYTISANNFADNDVHVYNLGAMLDMDALAAANNWPGGYFIAGQIIYSSFTEVIYVDAPKELIQDSENQVYSIKALSIEALRGYTIQVKIPKAYFAQPTNFNIGPDFGASYYFLPMDVSDTEYWIYDVSGAMLGGVPGVTGSNVVLFTFEATSLADVDNIPVGTYIMVPLAGVELRDDQNPYNVIPCLATVNKLVLIDATEPTLVHNNAGTYPSGMTLSVLGDGSGDIDRPIMDLTYSDNYNLDDAMYMILPDGDSAPTMISQFTLEIFLNFDGATNTINWQLPAQVNDLTDGAYTVYYLVVDDAGNYSIYDWDFVIDITPPNPIVWDFARITPDEDESVELKMAWGDSTVPVGSYASAWVWNYNLNGGSYPVYNPAGFSPTIPGPPNPYDSADQNGWHRIYYGPFVEEYTWDAGARSYYYFTVFAQDASGNYSAAPANPFYRESLSYWPGDVVTATDPTTPSVVTGADVAALSAVWGYTSTNPSWNAIVDVGPSVGYYRTGRPTPDGIINIEDLMMFAMNWKNTNYDFYNRNSVTGTKPMPIGIQLQTSSEDNLVRVDFVLNNNNGQLKGLNIPVLYGSGLVLHSVQSGSIWSDSSLLLYTNENNILEVSVSELGGDSYVSENGIIATAFFTVVGSETGFALQRMIARNIENSDIGILNNPSAPTEIEDIIVPVPQNYVLGNNYPNPFNPNTTISFGMKEAGFVKVTVFNSRGQIVRTLVDAKKDAGYHQVVWNGKDDNNRTLASGMYFYRMEANGFAETRKALLMK